MHTNLTLKLLASAKLSGNLYSCIKKLCIQYLVCNLNVPPLNGRLANGAPET